MECPLRTMSVDGVCVDCPDKCRVCLAGPPVECTECRADYFLQPDGTCSDTINCPDGEFFN